MSEYNNGISEYLNSKLFWMEIDLSNSEKNLLDIGRYRNINFASYRTIYSKNKFVVVSKP